MSFSIISGDLFDPGHGFEALAQGVNTEGVMGAGIAVAFRQKYPDMYESYKELCIRYGSTLNGLIHIFNPELKSEINLDPELEAPMITVDFGTAIYNLFTQQSPGRGNARYEYLKTSLILMRQDAELNMYTRVGMPWIGCGIGGLEKHNVQHLMEKILGDSEVEFVLVEQP